MLPPVSVQPLSGAYYRGDGCRRGTRRLGAALGGRLRGDAACSAPAHRL